MQPAPAAPKINSVCRCCNDSLVTANHPVDLFGPKTMKDAAIETLKSTGLHIKCDDGLPQNVCRPCLSKVIKVKQFINVCLHSKKQQESVLRFKRARKASDSPSSAHRLDDRRKKVTVM